jgi:RNA polymerase sigma-70 factor (ECF subfamily)
MGGCVALAYPGKPDEEDAARACLGTYYAGSSNIVFVAFRSVANSGEGSQLPLTRGRSGDLPACQPVETPGKDVDDDTLARAGMAGHAWAQREIWYRFAPMVFALLRRSLGARHEPEDLLQEVFLRVYGRLSTLTNPGALRSFIYSFAVRVVSEEMRRHRIRSRLGAIFFRPVAEPSVPHVDFESREMLSRVQSVLDGMSARPRAVFVLRRLEGMELSEIATSMDLSLATVKRDLDKANTHVARAIESDGRLRTRIDGDSVRSAMSTLSTQSTKGGGDGRS